MAFIDLIPSTVTADAGWSGLSNLKLEDNVYTINAASQTGNLYIEFYSGTHSNSMLPLDAIINGIQVFYTAKATGITGAGATGNLDFNLYSTNTRTALGSAIRSKAFTTTETASAVGSTTNTFGTPVHWVDLNKLVNGIPAGNPWFGLRIKAASSVPDAIWIDSLYLRVNYTSYGYLVGSRGSFHLGRTDLEKDVIMAGGVAQSTSYIKRKDNGPEDPNQIKSLDVNLIGDALYNIESALQASSGSVYAVDLKKTYVFAITVSAHCSSSVTTNALVYGKLVLNGSDEVASTVNIINPSKSVAPSVSGTVMCNFTSAIAWLEYGNSPATLVTTPLYAYAQGAKFVRTEDGVDYVIGVTALASSLGTAADYDLQEAPTTNNPLPYKGYIGSLFTAAPCSGKVFFKIFAMGREV